MFLCFLYRLHHSFLLLILKLSILALRICLITRRSLSLQSVSDIAVQEIQKILVVHPMLVLTTKAASLQDKFTSREVIRFDSVHFLCPK